MQARTEPTQNVRGIWWNRDFTSKSMSHALMSVLGVSVNGLKLETIFEMRKPSFSDEDEEDGVGGEGVDGDGTDLSEMRGAIAVRTDIGAHAELEVGTKTEEIGIAAADTTVDDTNGIPGVLSALGLTVATQF